MKKIILIYLLILVSLTSQYSYSKGVEHILYFDYRNEALVSIKLGVDSLATDNYDIDLGEQDIPPLPPPDAVIPVLEILDTVKNEMKYSQIEYKKLESGIFSKTFMIRLMGNAQEDFKFLVKGLPNGVDSMIIKDKISGNFFRWVVSKDEENDTTVSRHYSQMAIEVFYNADKITSIKDDLENEYSNNEKLNEYLNSNITIIDNKINILNNDIKLLNVFDLLGQNIEFNENMNLNYSNKNNIIFLFIEYNNKRHLVKKIF